jgi:hypothetical protein
MVSATPKTGRSRDMRGRLFALGSAAEQSRGRRFARRAGLVPDAKPLPTLADMINLPDWILCEADMADDIAAVTALLHFRSAIDQELSGTKLRSICDCVGEGNYDIACSAPIPKVELIADQGAKLPLPDQLKGIGQTMLNRALPVTMAATVDEACGDINMRHLSNIATALVMARHSVAEEATA